GFPALGAMEPPAGRTPAAQSALAIFALCLVYWVTNVIPLMVTSLLAMVLLPTTGVLSAKDTYALFGNEAVFFILGAFILAASLMKCGLSTRIAIAVLRRFGHTPRTLLLSLYLMNAFMAFFMSDHAVAAILVAGWTVILRFFPIDVASVRDADAVIEEKALRMGRPSAQERAIGLVMLGTLAAWIVGGEEFGLATIALAGVTVLFVLDIV